MPNLRDIKEQITSVKSTSQITEAMQLVSASRMQKAQDRVLSARPYIHGIYELIQRLGKVNDYKSPYLRQVAYPRNIALLTVGTSRGFVGSLVSNLTSEVLKLKKKLNEKYPDAKLHGISLYKTAQKVYAHARIENTYHFAKISDTPSSTEMTPIYQLFLENFTQGSYDLIYVIYTSFVSTMVQKPVAKSILPISYKALDEDEEKDEQEVLGEKNGFKFEPSPEAILDFVLSEYFESQIYLAVLESHASEHSARMVAMQNATENSKVLAQKLTNIYNKARQGQITQDLIEVINGAGDEEGAR